MRVTLEQAIEIHAKALRHNRGPHAPVVARRRAEQLAAVGDQEGFVVWLKVAEVAETLPDWKPEEDELGADPGRR